MPAETTIQTQAEVEEKMVDLPAEGDSVDVELPKKVEKTINSDPQEETGVIVEETASSEEMDDYGKKVQSRIDKLTKRVRESERREQAAIQFAQGVQGEAEQLRQKAGNLDRGYIAEYEQRVKAETEDTKAKLKSAMDNGDSDGVIAAQQDLARLAVESERAKATIAQRQRMAKAAQSPAADQYQQPQQPQQQQYQQPPPVDPDPAAEDWAEKNEWFGKDEPMTLTAFSIHRNLIEEGVDPSTKIYYNELDKRLKNNFPHKFNQSSTPTQTVASVNRGGPIQARKGTVRLSPSQVAIAKKLGVPLSEYAKYVKE
tara:strand:- start:7 stop:948 length:942 start_codon:yes stop_codon:yes gene_type:complete